MQSHSYGPLGVILNSHIFPFSLFHKCVFVFLLNELKHIALPDILPKVKLFYLQL